MVPSIYCLMCEAELVTEPEPSNTLKPHLEATRKGKLAWSRLVACNGLQLTKDLVADVVFPDEVTEELFVDSGLVHHSSIPECAAQLNCLQQNWLSFLEAQVRAQTKAQAHCAKAWRWDLQVTEGDCLDHFC